MTPTHYTIKDGVTTFHYPFSWWRYFVTRGKEVGDVGPILIKREETLMIYRMFGTIENPCTTPHKMSMKHHEIFDGPLPTDQEICTPPKPREKGDYSFHIIDLSK